MKPYSGPPPEQHPSDDPVFEAMVDRACDAHMAYLRGAGGGPISVKELIRHELRAALGAPSPPPPPATPESPADEEVLRYAREEARLARRTVEEFTGSSNSEIRHALPFYEKQAVMWERIANRLSGLEPPPATPSPEAILRAAYAAHFGGPR